ncbi:uncharacterized protein BDZ83DRAFT_788865, partial [Colletotrichum acutatum]
NIAFVRRCARLITACKAKRLYQAILLLVICNPDPPCRAAKHDCLLVLPAFRRQFIRWSQPRKGKTDQDSARHGRSNGCWNVCK